MTTLTRRQATTLAGSTVLAAVSANQADAAASPPPLFPGEQVVQAGGFPSLLRFVRGNPAKPLVVFLPGTSFLARIAYGYPGGQPEDFLETWLLRLGFSFLGTSYPLANAVYGSAVYPGFTIANWGQQAAAAAQAVIKAAGLGRQIIAVGWSMGGKPVVQLARAARALGLDLSLFIALDALPPGANLFPGNAGAFRLAPNGLVDQTATLVPWFEAMLDQQNRIAGHVIIPPDILRTVLTGNPPLDLQGENLRFQSGKMVSDPAAAAADSAAEAYADYPPLALIISNTPADYPNVLLCRSNWSRPFGQQLYRSLIFPHKDRIATLSPAGWAALQSAVTGAEDRLTVQIPGTHFLFVGAPGAAQTAAAIAHLAGQSAALRQQVATLLE